MPRAFSASDTGNRRDMRVHANTHARARTTGAAASTLARPRSFSLDHAVPCRLWASLLTFAPSTLVGAVVRVGALAVTTLFDAAPFALARALERVTALGAAVVLARLVGVRVRVRGRVRGRVGVRFRARTRARTRARNRARIRVRARLGLG